MKKIVKVRMEKEYPEAKKPCGYGGGMGGEGSIFALALPHLPLWKV